MTGAVALIITSRMQKNRTKIYTVSQVNSLIKAILENNLPGRLTITGQISDWRHHQSGHCYFSLKDENAVLPCVMWKSKFNNVRFEPEDGLAVLATGYIDVYPPHGRYQFMVDKLVPAGVGALQLAFEQMRRRLKEEGLFKEEHKKPLPAYPQRIGILTSESGAAVHDIKDSIHNRWPCAKLFLYPVPVQGEGAAEEIASALRDVNRRNKELRLDILIVGRGGGSLEDLWAFNEEVLARAIFDSKIPVISAVGHEVDTTIADLVADARASTPTKAGVITVPDMQEVLMQLAGMQSRLTANLKAVLKLAQQNLKTLLASAVFRSPLLPIRYAEQQLDQITIRLQDCSKSFLAQLRERLQLFYERVLEIEPHRLLGKKTVDLNDLRNRADVGVRAILNDRQIHLTGVENRTNTALKAIINGRRLLLTAQASRLAPLNPKSVLQRGYSITTNQKTGRVIAKLDDIEIGDLLTTELADEKLIESKVTKK